ncbi:MAG: MFS transporter [Candidatus Gracilibacteria bacterium]|nr:MFS transporter [Candidatus Gracilibacteria bacterium]
MKTAARSSWNIPIMYLSSVMGGILFFLPVLALYFEESLFTTTNVAIVFSVEAFCAVLFEVPTGAAADLFGRKKILILAYLFTLFAIGFLYFGGGMRMFIIYAILNAFARSLSSGTESALIYDTLQESGQEKAYKKTIGTMGALWPLGASIGSIIGAYLARNSLSSTISWTFLPVTIAFFLLFFLKEPEYEKEDHKNVLKHMLHSSKLIIHSKQLILIFAAYFIMMAFGESVHLLSPLFFKFKEVPIEYFGWISAFSFGLSSLGFYLSNNVSERFGNKKTLLAVTLLSPIFILIATLSTGFPLMFFWVMTSVYFGIKNPIISHLLNLEVASSKRATVLSVNNFMGQLGVAIVAPFFGYLAELYTIQTAVQISALILMIVPVMFVFVQSKD